MSGPAARASGPRAALAAALTGALLLCALAAGCGTSQPKPVATVELAAAQSFPYYRVYWVGRSFRGAPLVATDGLNGYITTVGDSVYYGDCVQGKGLFGASSCHLPLQVTTVVYGRHPNKSLGTQENIVVRGVPAVVYDEGRSLELYSGRLAIDIFSDTLAHALQAAEALYPINSQGSSREALPPPVYCPGLSGHESGAVARVMASLPGHACQLAAAQVAYDEAVKRSTVPLAPQAYRSPGAG